MSSSTVQQRYFTPSHTTADIETFNCYHLITTKNLRQPDAVACASMTDLSIDIIRASEVVLRHAYLGSQNRLKTDEIHLRSGRDLYKLCESFKNAPEEFEERTLEIAACWMRISSQLDLTPQIVQIMNEEQIQAQQKITSKTLEKLLSVYDELLAITSGIKAEGGNDGVRGLSRMRVKFAWRKQFLDEAIKELQKWQKVQDTTWVTIVGLAKKTLDGTRNGDAAGSLGDSAKVPGASRAPTTRQSFLPLSILQSSTATSLWLSNFDVITIKGEIFLVDAFSYPQSPKNMTCPVSRDIRNLVKKLQDNETHLSGLLSCKGAFKEDIGVDRKFSLLFRLPLESAGPQSLRAALTTDTRPPLSDIIQIGQNIAEAISLVHAFGFVHKNIGPETVVLLEDKESGRLSTFLVGFERFRLDGGYTAKLGDESWGKNLYRHPTRQGRSPEQTYIMQHDIYSLGVCLLEIGVWKSFVHSESMRSAETDSPNSMSQSSSWFREHVWAPEILNSEAVKKELVLLADTHLRLRMGNRYANIVKTCLTCLDAENEDFGNESEFLDQDGILVGVRYIEKVCVIQGNEVTS